MACSVINEPSNIMTSGNPETMEIDQEPTQEMKDFAEQEKRKGNDFYKAKDYSQAVSHYTQAINIWPENASFYNNRSAAQIMLGRYREALEDAQTAIRKDSAFAKAYLREAKCHIAMGNAQAALLSLQTAKELDPASDHAVMVEVRHAQAINEFQQQSDTAFANKEYRQVVYCMRRLSEIAPACIRFKLVKAESLALMGKYSEAQDIAIGILHKDSRNADAIYIRGICLYYDDIIDKAVTFFTQTLRLSPDHRDARLTLKKAKLLASKKQEGNEAFKRSQSQRAFELYSEALQIDPNNRKTNAKLFCNRALVGSKLGKHGGAVDDCTKALELDPNYIKALQRRAKSLGELERFEEAVYDCQKVFQLDKTRENKDLLRRAEADLKRSKRKDFYKILSVPRDATDEQIKKAYRKQALLHHPDRHSGATTEQKKVTEQKFKEVGEAYAVLSDRDKRGRYDRGEDLDSPGGMPDFDANNIFQMFFGGGGGMGGMGGGFQQQQQGNFPGGFTFQFG